MKNGKLTMSEIDWQALAYKLGYITKTESGHTESGGTKNARTALTDILGEELLRGAVDFCVSGRRGAETARSVLWSLQPPCAMERCHEIFRSSKDEAERSEALNLLKVVADERVLSWVPEYLADHNLGVQTWGIGIVDQLAWSGNAEPEQCMPLIKVALEHSNERVRETAQFVMEYLRERAEKEHEIPVLP
jgi:HEAT repeat protein